MYGATPERSETVVAPTERNTVKRVAIFLSVAGVVALAAGGAHNDSIATGVKMLLRGADVSTASCSALEEGPCKQSSTCSWKASSTRCFAKTSSSGAAPAPAPAPANPSIDADDVGEYPVDDNVPPLNDDGPVPAPSALPPKSMAPSTLPDSLMPTSAQPIPKPTSLPSLKPTSVPTAKPYPKPTFAPSTHPTMLPGDPSAAPVFAPTHSPSPRPTLSPTPRPTNNPTPRPTNQPTNKPTNSPTPRPTPQPTTWYCKKWGWCDVLPSDDELAAMIAAEENKMQESS